VLCTPEHGTGRINGQYALLPERRYPATYKEPRNKPRESAKRHAIPDGYGAPEIRLAMFDQLCPGEAAEHDADER
jgi:hypothetical protein